MVVLLGGGEPRYADMSKTLMDTANECLLFRTMLPGENGILISGRSTSTATAPSCRTRKAST